MAGTDISRIMDLVTQGIANDFRNALVQRCPVDTGRLKTSIKVDSDKKGEITISMAEHGVYVEFGTAPHIIKAKNGEALKFKIGNKTVFAKQVNHPGTRPNPFIRTTILKDIPKIVEKNFERQFK